MQLREVEQQLRPIHYRAMYCIIMAIIIQLVWGDDAQAQSVRYRDEVFTSITRNTSVTYGSATGINNQPVTLQCEVFQPSNDNQTKRPLLIMVHGGGFTTGNRFDDRILLVCSTFARRGYVAISPSYRLGLESNSTTSFFEAVLRGSQDIKALVRFCKSNATQLGIDTSMIFVGGGSAGGYIALATAYLDKQSEYAAGTNVTRWGQPEGSSNTITNHTSRIRGVVNLYGALFDTQWMESGNVPVASCHGTNDQTVPHTANTYGMYSTPAITARAQALGIPNQQLLIAGMWHGPATTETAYWSQMVNFTRDFIYPIVASEINNTSPSVPTLVFPTDNATQIVTPLTLRWNRATNALSYTIQVANTNTFTSTIHNQTLSDTVFQTTGLRNGEQYYWRVRALGSGNTQSAWSTAFTFTTRTSAVQRDTCSMGIGMNLSLHTHYNHEQPFADLMKSASAWMTSNSRWVSGGTNAWDTKLSSSLSYDNNGYVTSAIPFWRSGVEDSQVVKVLIHRDIDGTYQSGDYVCLFDGDGRINVSFDAAVVSRSTGRVNFRVATPSNAGILLTIERSNSQNPIRNIRIVHSSRINTYRANPFNEEFINKLRPFPVLRFMQWAKTNDNPATAWSARRPTTFYTQASNAHTSGVSWEYMFQLCNITKKDAWICLPHNVDSIYIAQLAALAHRELDSNLRIYLEYSNEVWNGIFPQRNWVEQNAPASLNSPQKYAFCFQRAFRIFMREWTGAERRIIRVAATQLDNPWLIRQMIAYVPSGTVDAVSPGGYLHLTNSAYQVLTQKGATATADDVFADARTYMNTPTTGGKARMREHSQIAVQNNLKIVLYEAGQHFTSTPFGTSQPYLPAIYSAQRDNRMYDLYREWMRFCRDSADVDLFCAYSFVRRIESQYGSWGSMNNLYANPSTQPKYRALQESSCFNSPVAEYPVDTAILTTDVMDDDAPNLENISIYPNPARTTVTIQSIPKCSITLYSQTGIPCMQKTMDDGKMVLDISSLPSGHYTVVAQSVDGTIHTQPLVIVR
jgi:acetyl esterase/lipase